MLLIAGKHFRISWYTKNVNTVVLVRWNMTTHLMKAKHMLAMEIQSSPRCAAFEFTVVISPCHTIKNTSNLLIQNMRHLETLKNGQGRSKLIQKWNPCSKIR